MASKEVYTVRIEPVGIEMEVEEDETVLDAAFRQGIALMHGCKEGQCGSCKAILTEGDAYEDIELLKYSTFALSDPEREQNHVLLCRTQLFGDVSIELLNCDEELLARSIPVAAYTGRVSAVEALTHDICRLEVVIEKPLKFWAGQYVDITLPDAGITRSFSMANAPNGASERLAFIIKKYSDGAFSSRLDASLAVGDELRLEGPFGTCFRRESRTGPMLLVGGGSGMSPLLSMLRDQLDSGEERDILFLYGARTRRDLFYLEEMAELAAAHPRFRFVPALSEAGAADAWEGESGFVHEVLARHLREADYGEDCDAYTCGPPPMIDAVLPVLQMGGLDSEHIHFDKFTPSTRSSEVR